MCASRHASHSWHGPTGIWQNFWFLPARVSAQSSRPCPPTAGVARQSADSRQRHQQRQASQPCCDLALNGLDACSSQSCAEGIVCHGKAGLALRRNPANCLKAAEAHQLRTGLRPQLPQQGDCAALHEHPTVGGQALRAEGQLAPGNLADLHDRLDRLRRLSTTHWLMPSRGSRPCQAAQGLRSGLAAPCTPSQCCAALRGTRTRAGLRNLSSCETYTAPGKAVPMRPGNSEAQSSPGSRMPGKPACAPGRLGACVRRLPAADVQTHTCSLGLVKVKVDGVGVSAGLQKVHNLLWLELLGASKLLPAPACCLAYSPSFCSRQPQASLTRPGAGCSATCKSRAPILTWQCHPPGAAAGGQAP